MADGHKQPLIRLSSETTYNKIMDISEKTRISSSKIVNMMVEYAMKHYSLIPAECYDIQFDEENEQ